MSLATRCTGCGTVFRVVQDQLRVSAGWVRCGRCGAVFNAVESLVDVTSDGAPLAPLAPPAPVAPAATRERVMQDLRRVGGRAQGIDTPPAAPTGDADGTGLVSEPAPEDDRAGVSEGADAGATVDAATRASVETETGTETEGPTASASHDALDPARADLDVTSAAPQPAEAPLPLPTFLRRAEQAARWQRPWVRVLLSLAAIAGAGGLASQAALLQHDDLAARWPAAVPTLTRLCEWAGCTIEPPRRIDGLAVLSSTLVRDGAPGRYRLGVTLRNRAAIGVRMPAFELTLSDARGRLLVRRVLQAGDFGSDRDRVDAGSELILEATVLAGVEPVVGYTIEIFYP